MKKFRFLSVVLIVAALPAMLSCSKSSSDDGEEQVESFQTINAKFYFGNSSLAPVSVNMGVGETQTLYVGHGSTKKIFGGPVSWTATGNGKVTLSAVQQTVGKTGPKSKATADYTTTNATTNSSTVLKIKATEDGFVSLTAKDALGNSKVMAINIFPEDS